MVFKQRRREVKTWRDEGWWIFNYMSVSLYVILNRRSMLFLVCWHLTQCLACSRFLEINYPFSTMNTIYWFKKWLLSISSSPTFCNLILFSLLSLGGLQWLLANADSAPFLYQRLRFFAVTEISTLSSFFPPNPPSYFILPWLTWHYSFLSTS